MTLQKCVLTAQRAGNWDGMPLITPLLSPSEGWQGTMIGLSESGMSLGANSLGYAVVLKIECHSQDDYDANFNRKTGCNKGAKEGADRVLITKRKRGTGYAVSTLVAKLSVGDSYTVNDFGGKRMTVLLNEIRWGLSNARASVQVTAN